MKMRYLITIMALCLLNTAWASNTNVVDDPAVKHYIQTLHQQHGFSVAYLNGVFNKARFRDDIIEKMNHPYEKQPWHRYRKHFLTEKRIAQGKKFWQQHAKTLAKAEKRFGVPASIIVAIIGVESHFGHYQGDYPVLSSLSTLAFRYPRRADFFRKELTAFLLFTRDEAVAPESILGSYAGAIGQPQFMPSSYRHYGIDFSGNGHCDLSHNTDDVIGSVANYLKQNGWHASQSIGTPAQVDVNMLAKITLNQRKPKMPFAQLSQLKIKPNKITNYHPSKQVSLFQFEGKNNKQYWLGFHNFYVITTYNTSPLYALAVTQLSRAIKASHDGNPKPLATITL